MQHNRRQRNEWGRRLGGALIVAAAVLLAAPGVLAAAQTRIGLNGGRPTEWPILSTVLASQGLTQQGWLDFASRVGENWLPGTTPVALNYPGQLGLVSGPAALTADQSTAVGQQLLHALILGELDKGQPVAVAGLSEGTLVIDRELSYLATLPESQAPDREALTFYVFGDMLRGLGQTYLPGVSIPLIGQTFGPVPQSRYDTVVVNEQWDGWANPPDRPWNLLAVVNAVMGAVYTVNGSNDHSQTSLDSLSDAIPVSQTTNSQGGRTTTYLVARQQLPLTRPLRQLGVTDWVVDEIDRLLTPLILTGYSTMTPNLGPRIDHGQLVFTPPTPVVTTTVADAAPTDPVSTRTDVPVASITSQRTTVKGVVREHNRPAPTDVDTATLTEAASSTDSVGADDSDPPSVAAADPGGTADDARPTTAPARPRPARTAADTADRSATTDADASAHETTDGTSPHEVRKPGGTEKAEANEKPSTADADDSHHAMSAG